MPGQYTQCCDGVVGTDSSPRTLELAYDKATSEKFPDGHAQAFVYHPATLCHFHFVNTAPVIRYRTMFPNLTVTRD